MMQRYPKLIIAVGVGLIIASAVGIAAVLIDMREDATADGVRSAENVATLLSEQTSNSVQSIELVLDGVVSEIRRQNLSTITGDNLCHEGGGIMPYASDRLAQISQASTVVIADKNGDVICTTIDGPAGKTNVRDRDYFQQALNSRDLGMLIGKPIISKFSGAWVLVFAKRLETGDGRFLGVVLIGMKIASLAQLYVAIQSIPGETISLVRRDGTEILRYPDRTIRAGRMIPTTVPWYEIVARGGGNYRSPGIFDGRARYVVVRPLAKYALVITVSITEEEVLAAWRTRAIVIGALSVAIQAALAFLLKSLFRQVHKLRRSEVSLKQAANDSALSSARFNATLTNISQGVAMFDAQGCIVLHNRKYQQIWGYSKEDLRAGTPISALLENRARRGLCPPSKSVMLLQKAKGAPPSSTGEVMELSDGRSIRVVNDPMPDGGWVSTHEDITESQRVNARIAYMAHHDVLTGLLNRGGFLELLRERKETAARDAFAVMLIDLDRFKEVNDTFGHLVGDEILCLVARRLEDATSHGDFVARLGGDEFAIFHRQAHTGGPRPQALAERVIEAIGASFTVGANEVSVGVSIGIATALDDSTDHQTILRSADLALYRAKSEGRNRFRMFEPSMEDDFQLRRRLIQDLKSAIAADQLRLFYQPIVDTQTLEVRGMEALARWPHPDRGMISPLVFIALAEEAGLINDLGEWALRRACLDALSWPAHIKVSVNVSGIQIGHPAFPKTVSRIIEETGLPPNRLELEITESTLVSDAQHALSTLEAVKRLGVTIALDDFGTGYSSLSYLKTFPFDVIKIDRSFIDDMQTHRGCATIVAAIQALASGFDMLVTAEGVETHDQFELLRISGIRQLQGYLFGKPAPSTNWDFSVPLMDVMQIRRV